MNAYPLTVEKGERVHGCIVTLTADNIKYLVVTLTADNIKYLVVTLTVEKGERVHGCSKDGSHHTHVECYTLHTPYQLSPVHLVRTR